MKEDILLNKALTLLNKEGTDKAYQFLVGQLHELKDISSQAYNFLYCLAATSGKESEALDWLHEAIVGKGFWYRPEVFEDEDLEVLVNNERFISYTKISEERYKKSVKNASMQFTLKDKKADNLIIVLHGNQQNNETSKIYWSIFSDQNYQVEYLQSEEIDSFNLFRWNDNGNGPVVLKEALDVLKTKNYKSIILAGFSAGCNVILRAFYEQDIHCDKIILQSPWIPAIKKNNKEIIQALFDKNIKALIICGQMDEDCLPLCKDFEFTAQESGLDCKIHYIDKLGHEYPDTFKTIVETFLDKQ